MTINQYNKTHILLLRTVRFLTIHPGDMRERLKDSYDIFHPLDVNHFPKFLERRWQSVLRRLTRYGCVTDKEGNLVKGSVENTMRRIRKCTAAKIAEDIVSISDDLSNYLKEYFANEGKRDPMH